MPCHVYFVRHARPKAEEHDDFKRCLSESGLQDRMLACKYLQSMPINAMYASPYPRAIETIQPLADALRLPIHTDERLRERKIGSGWIDDFDSFARAQWSDFSYSMPEGESLSEVEKRNTEALSEIINANPDGTVIIGTHMTALSTVIHHYIPEYGYEDFCHVVGVMPWIAHMAFASPEKPLFIDAIDVFTEQIIHLMKEGKTDHEKL